MQFKSIEEVDNYLNNDDNYDELTDRQILRQKQKARRNANIDADKVFDGNDWVVYIPRSYEASCKLGVNTQWCTATTESDEYYRIYTSDGDLYIVINKKDPKLKYQFFFDMSDNGDSQYMDVNDDSINIYEFLYNNKELSDYFLPIASKAWGITYDDDYVTASISDEYFVRYLDASYIDDDILYSVIQDHPEGFDYIKQFYIEDIYQFYREIDRDWLNNDTITLLHDKGYSDDDIDAAMNELNTGTEDRSYLANMIATALSEAIIEDSYKNNLQYKEYT